MIKTPATNPKESSLTNSFLLTTDIVNPAKMQPTVPAAPISPIQRLDSDGFNTPIAIPQKRTIGSITIVSHSM